jgi:cholesterol oxidase
LKPRYHLEFTEEMKGWFAFGETDFQPGFDRGQAAGWAVMFHLTISTEDTYAFVADPETRASAAGWVQSEALGGRLPLERGVFNLFVDAGEKNGMPARHMLYRLWFRDAAGHPLTLTGFKDVSHPAAAGATPGDVWRETTTLYIRILAGHIEVGADGDGAVIGSGILRILPLDFARQCTTFRVRGPGVIGGVRALGAFDGLFMGQLWEVFRMRLPGRDRDRGMT